jgi:hypothetical protein
LFELACYLQNIAPVPSEIIVLYHDTTIRDVIPRFSQLIDDMQFRLREFPVKL